MSLQMRYERHHSAPHDTSSAYSWLTSAWFFCHKSFFSARSKHKPRSDEVPSYREFRPAVQRSRVHVIHEPAVYLWPNLCTFSVSGAWGMEHRRVSHIGVVAIFGQALGLRRRRRSAVWKVYHLKSSHAPDCVCVCAREWKRQTVDFVFWGSEPVSVVWFVITRRYRLSGRFEKATDHRGVNITLWC